MASFATTTEAGDGSNLVFDVKFEFISRADVDVYRLAEGDKPTDTGTKLELIDSGVPADDQYIWLNNEKIQVGTAPTSVEQIKIQRTTDFTQQTVQWQDGSYIVAQDLNTSEEQNLFVDQELADWLGNITGGGTGPDSLIDLEDLGDVDDVITEEEMEDGVTEPRWVDGAFASAGAQKRFFQPIQSALKPDIGPIEKGRFWYQEYGTAAGKEVQSFNIWNGSGWRNISSGQVVPNPFQPDSIIYVDPQGNDNNPGRKPDEAYRTIKAAVEEANSKVPSTVSTVDNAVYDNVSGFINIQTTASHDLIAGYTITLSPITWSCVVDGKPGTKAYPPSPKEFRVSSIVSPGEFRFYVGPTPKVHTYESGGVVTPLDVRKGDGYTVQCAPGVYHEKLPILIEAKNLSIIGTSLRNTYVHPDIYESSSSAGGSGIPPYESPDRRLMPIFGQQGPPDNRVDIYEQEVQIMFEMDSGSYLTGFTFCGLKSIGARGVGGVDDDPTLGLPGQQGWVSAHRNRDKDNNADKAFITKSPYIQNCTHFSDLNTNNADFDINFLAGEGGDTDSGPAGGGILVDGERVNPSSPLRSYVVDSFTQISLGGPGVLATNNGYAQLVSFFGTFCWYHAKSKNGGQLNLSNCTSDFGQYGLIADGKSPSSIFQGSLKGDALAGDQFFQVESFTRGTQWDVPRTMTPVDNMVVDVGGTLYPILSSRKNSTGYEINIFAPKSDESAVKVPANKSNVINAVYDNTTGFVTITTDKAHQLLAGRTAFISPMVWRCTGPDGTDSFPRKEEELKVQDVTGSTTFIVYVGPNDKSHTYVSGGVVTPTDINPDTFENGGLQKEVPDGTTIKFYLQSYISTGGHTMEFVGSGTDYNAHPDFGGVPRPENQTLEVGGLGPAGSRLAYLNGGRIWLSSTDENGNFKVGETFVVNQKTGSIYILPEAVKSTFRLTEDLDLRGYKIWQDPATAGRNADLQLQPAGEGDVILGTNGYESDGLTRINPAAIREPILERGLDDNRKWPVVTQRDLGYDADEVPVSCLLGKLAFTDSAPAVTATTSAPLPNEIKFSVSGNELTITYQPADGSASKSHKLTLTT